MFTKGERMRRHGFLLVEVMIVVVIISFLAMICVPSFKRYLAKARRAEAYLNLGSIYTAEKMYWAEHGTYTAQLAGVQGAGWRPEGYHGGGTQERFFYSYGFGAGKEGEHYFTGKLGTAAGDLKMGYADKQGFLAIAAGDIDGDGKPDIIGINDKHEIVVIQDDLSE